MNVKDTERMLGILAERGFSVADDPGEADLLIVNTCTVREKPQRKVMGTIGRWKALKDRRPGTVIAVAGCVAQQMGKDLLDKAPYLDAVIGTQMIHRLPEVVERARRGERVNAVERLERGDPDLFTVPGSPPGKVTAFVSVMQGCDNFCAYCIVPFVRGPAVSRGADHVLKEVRALASAGVREVTLLGQNVNAYQDGETSFPRLLLMVAEVPGIERVRFTTSHPKDLGPQLIEAMASHPKVMEHLHLPVQAGSDRVLERMNRGYTRRHYLGLVDRLREAMPDAGLTADLIVGFPGEEEEDFLLTLDLMERVRYDETFSFRYSERPGTAAAKYSGKVAEEEKYNRLYRLQELQGRITREKNLQQVGKTHQVLVEGPGKSGGGLTGRTRTNRIVHFPGGLEKPGDVVMVEIKRALKHSLAGEVSRDEDSALRPKEEICLSR